MEYVSTVFVNGYALNILAINISAEMASFVDNKAFFTVFCRFVGKNVRCLR